MHFRFVILISVYCVAGMIVMRVKYEKTGTDIIPNKTLWFSLPSLVKVKCVYVCTCTVLPTHLSLNLFVTSWYVNS